MKEQTKNGTVKDSREPRMKRKVLTRRKVEKAKVKKAKKARNEECPEAVI